MADGIRSERRTTMNQQDPTTSIEARLRTLQMLVGALIFGVITFAAIAAFAPIRPGAPLNPTVQTTLMVAMVGIMIAAMAARSLFRSSILRSVDGEVDEGRLFGRFAALTIITAAIFEGAALLGVTLFLLSRDPTDLVIAGAALLLLYSAAYPTRSRWETLLADATYRPR